MVALRVTLALQNTTLFYELVQCVYFVYRSVSCSVFGIDRVSQVRVDNLFCPNLFCDVKLREFCMCRLLDCRMPFETGNLIKS